LQAREPKLISALRQWWRDERQNAGVLRTTSRLLAIVYQFLRDTVPDRRRHRFGDMDYDWEFRMDTTSANVGWRSRLMGLFNSAYQPIEPALFREIMGSLAIDFSQFIFIDIGSGKGRALLLAAEYPFKGILGIELLPELHAIAQQNIDKFLAERPGVAAIESVCADATEFPLPHGPLFILLNNSLPERALRAFIANVEGSMRAVARPVFLIYTNPVLESVLDGSALLRKRAGTHQYSIFEARLYDS
jgi:SAM-dependent methyltransferase